VKLIVAPVIPTLGLGAPVKCFGKRRSLDSSDWSNYQWSLWGEAPVRRFMLTLASYFVIWRLRHMVSSLSW